MYYMIMVRVWTNDYSDYIDGEYDGIQYTNIIELKNKAKKLTDEGLDVYIKQYG